MPQPIRWVMKLFDHLLVIGMSSMSLLVFWNVVLRYGFNSGIAFSVEVSRLIFVWIVFLGSVAALAQSAHMSVDALVKNLPKPLRVGAFLVAHCLMLWVCWLLWQGSYSVTMINWNNRLPISGISVGLMYAAGLVASVCMAVILVVNLWRSIWGKFPETWTPMPDLPSKSLDKSA
jgi:TRAP-type transport system small permease protein